MPRELWHTCDLHTSCKTCEFVASLKPRVEICQSKNISIILKFNNPKMFQNREVVRAMYFPAWPRSSWSSRWSRRWPKKCCLPFLPLRLGQLQPPTEINSWMPNIQKAQGPGLLLLSTLRLPGSLRFVHTGQELASKVLELGGRSESRCFCLECFDFSC